MKAASRWTNFRTFENGLSGWRHSLDLCQCY